MSNNSSVAHSFAYGQNDKGSNFYSESYGNLLYSYSSLLARKFENGIILISEPIANYSNSSQRHHIHLRRAISHMEYYYVSDLSSYGKLEDYLNISELEVVNKELINLYNKQKRARKADYSWSINQQIEKGNAILKYGKIDKRNSIYKQFIKIINQSDLDTILEDAEKAKKLEQQRIAKQRYKANKNRFEAFTGIKCPYNASELNNYQFIRINGDILQTSGSVSVNLKEARILYKAYKSNKNVIGEKIGYYTIIKANKNVVQIGCHHIMAKELDRVLGE